MSGFLLDTNCISELVRPKPDARVEAWMEAADETMLYLSVLTLGEIRLAWLRANAGPISKHVSKLNCKAAAQAEFCRLMPQLPIDGVS